jgi:hypothetical protein
VDLIGQADFLVRVQHRHSDGTWGELAPRPSHHDAADHDPERDWANGRIYVCTTCDEEVRISEDREDREPLGGR